MNICKIHTRFSQFSVAFELHSNDILIYHLTPISVFPVDYRSTNILHKMLNSQIQLYFDWPLSQFTQNAIGLCASKYINDDLLKRVNEARMLSVTMSVRPLYFV